MPRMKCFVSFLGTGNCRLRRRGLGDRTCPEAAPARPALGLFAEPRREGLLLLRGKPSNPES